MFSMRLCGQKNKTTNQQTKTNYFYQFQINKHFDYF